MTAASLPPRQRSARAGLWTALRLLVGLALLAALVSFMWTPGEWPTRLFAWVLLTILADECAGWFGYAGLALGGLAFFAPSAPPEQWTLIVPLVGGALFALLLLKHSGGPFVLPFAALIFAGALYATGRFGLKIDPELTLPANATFQRSAVVPMLLGLGFSFVRQLIGNATRFAARRRSVPAAPAAAVADLHVAPEDPEAAGEPKVSLDKARRAPDGADLSGPGDAVPGTGEEAAVPTPPAGPGR
ncbi:hypothetical protein [Deinococcus petrolearius]|uniref:Uncharacterized protein n=1 Tax=Deinococcus petrolearius TaxID=1751295 RepID=A0ABW1DMN6_9DEIO